MARNGDARNELENLLSSLAGLPGARTDAPAIRFEVKAISDAMNQIRRLQGTGSLTINFSNGKPNGLAEWKAKG